MTTQAASKLTRKEVYNLLKAKGHTDFSANEISEAHENGRDFSFLF